VRCPGSGTSSWGYTPLNHDSEGRWRMCSWRPLFHRLRTLSASLALHCLPTRLPNFPSYLLRPTPPVRVRVSRPSSRGAPAHPALSFNDRPRLIRIVGSGMHTATDRLERMVPSQHSHLRFSGQEGPYRTCGHGCAISRHTSSHRARSMALNRVITSPSRYFGRSSSAAIAQPRKY
jgi:hypothetical protein